MLTKPSLKETTESELKNHYISLLIDSEGWNHPKYGLEALLRQCIELSRKAELAIPFNVDNMDKIREHRNYQQCYEAVINLVYAVKRNNTKR